MSCVYELYKKYNTVPVDNVKSGTEGVDEEEGESNGGEMGAKRQ